MIYIDVTQTVSSELNTGIQRVVRELTRELVSIDSEIKLVYFNGGDSFCECSLDDIQLRVVPVSTFKKLKRYFKKITPVACFKFLRVFYRFFDRGIHRCVNFISTSCKQYAPDSGDKLEFKSSDQFIILDSVWHKGEVYSKALKKVTERGVRVILVSYDLIPITHPQFCDAGLVHHFKNFYQAVIPLVDEFIAISKYSMDTLKEFIEKDFDCDLNKLKFHYFYLAHTPMIAEHETCRSEITELVGNRRFILSVSTIEPRKNYSLLLKSFLNAKIPKDVTLVIVGRDGWKNDEIKSLMNSPGRVIWYSDCLDHELKELYKGCLFTVFPSFVEGFGLPVLESLSQGKFVLSSNEGALPEAGREFVDYFSPFKQCELEALLDKYLNDTLLLQEKESEITRNFSSTSWRASALDFLTKLGLDSEHS